MRVGVRHKGATLDVCNYVDGCTAVAVNVGTSLEQANLVVKWSSTLASYLVEGRLTVADDCGVNCSN